MVTGSKLGPALKVPERARTLPPKSPQSSSEWPPTVSSPLLSCQRPTYRPHQSPRKAARPQAFLPPSKTFSLPPSSFIKPIFLLVARGHLLPATPALRTQLLPQTPPVSAARDQATDKMAPEPTPDHHDHKKKVNLTCVVYQAMPGSWLKCDCWLTLSPQRRLRR